MPEGDSLVRVADRLRPVLAGHRLTRTDFRVPRLAVTDLSGREVDAVWPRAKYLIIQAGDHAILSHLKMEGRWEAYPRFDDGGRPVRPRWRHPGWQARCVLETTGHQVVGFQLGLLEVLATAAVPERLSFLGPDLLDPDWADPGQAELLLAEAVHRLGSDPDRPIGTALLDQRLLSGIGNIYRCETLLLARLDPHRPVSSVEDLPGLVLLARQLLRTNTGAAVAEYGGGRRSTTRVLPDEDQPYGIRVLAADDPRAIRRAGGPDAARGRGPRRRALPHTWVYGREQAGCLRCGGPVQHEPFGDPPAPGPDNPAMDRDLYWCPHCQR